MIIALIVCASFVDGHKFWRKRYRHRTNDLRDRWNGFNEWLLKTDWLNLRGAWSKNSHKTSVQRHRHDHDHEAKWHRQNDHHHQPNDYDMH